MVDILEPANVDKDIFEVKDKVEKYRYLWNLFQEFENFAFNEAMSSFSQHVAEWKRRREELENLGFHFDNNVLAFKLLKSLNLSTEALLAVFAGLKLGSQDLLQLTLDCLTGIIGGKHAGKPSPYKLMEETQFEGDNLDHDVLMDPHSDNENEHPIKEEENIEENDEENDEEFETKVGSESACNICPKKFDSNDELTNHIKSAHKKLNKCVTCHETFYKAADLYNHLKTHSKKGSVPYDYARKKDLPSVFQCEHCGENLKDRKAYTGHVKRHTGFKCVDCSKYFGSQEQLDTHIENHKKYPCDQCDKVFMTFGKYKCHIETESHGAKKNYACEKCGKQYYCKSNLITHQKSQHEKKRYVCPVEGCSKEFVIKSLLIKHNLTHTGEKAFECEECGKCYATKYKLGEHKRGFHLKEKRHQCPSCDKGFFQKEKLKRHIRIHTGERPYQCDVCNKTFVQSKDWKIHVKKH